MKKPKTTDKQAKAMQLIREGKNPTQAMKEAGYSESTSSHPDTNLLQLKGAQSIIEQYKAEYLKLGITPRYMAKKTSEWLEATKIKSSMTEPDRVVPDYQTQLKAAEYVRKDWGMESDKNINIDAKILVIPSELMGKYAITSNTENSSTG